MWKVLRAILRAEPNAAPGRDLRPDMSRKTKDGSFLDKLAALGLIEGGLPLVSEPGDDKRPVPFRKHYRLTDAGRKAAEFGECLQTYGTEPKKAGA
jgi:hypothetical protein